MMTIERRVRLWKSLMLMGRTYSMVAKGFVEIQIRTSESSQSKTRINRQKSDT
jgi:hypothetical protein